MVFFGIKTCAAISALNSGVRGETFSFRSGDVEIVGVSEATLTVGQFTMNLAAKPTGALLRKTLSADGLGVTGATINGVNDPGGLSDFTILDGDLEGVGESVEFSFDRPGILTGFDFDGLSDERLELFVLETESGLRVNFLDSRANMPNTPNAMFEHPLDAALRDGAIVGDVILLLEDSATGLDDEIHSLAIPFAAGQTFHLTFGAAGQPYSQDSNFGGRLQGIEVQAVPEPSTFVLLGLPFAGFAGRRQRYPGRSADRGGHPC